MLHSTRYSQLRAIQRDLIVRRPHTNGIELCRIDVRLNQVAREMEAEAANFIFTTEGIACSDVLLLREPKAKRSWFARLLARLWPGSF